MTADRPGQCMEQMKTRMTRFFTLAVWCGVALVGSLSLRAASAGELFTMHCVPCHGKDGKAQTPVARKLGVKDLTQSKATDGEMEKQITEGKKDDRGNQKMPPFKDKLSPEEIKSLIMLVKNFRKP